MAYEYVDSLTGCHYWVEGNRVYRITTRGNLIYDHDVTPEQPAGPASWQRLLTTLRRLFGL